MTENDRGQNRVAEADTGLSGPFGDPEGSRADLQRVMSDFVDFDDGPSRGDLVIDRQNLLRGRIIVGGKGTGKSVYLRRLQALASERASDGAIYSELLYADQVRRDVPTTEAIVRVSDWYEQAYRNEKWQWLWRRAIVRSLVSHLLRAPRLRAALSVSEIDELESDYATLYRKFTKPLSIYSQLREILSTHTSPGGLNRYLEQHEWNDLEASLGEMLKGCPAVCFYIDAIDDEFANAPAYWLSCQLGLFNEAWRLLQDPLFGGKLHVIICIRDIVFSSLLRTEHADRYRDSSYIRMLTWDHASLQYFLRAKLERIRQKNDRCFLGESDDIVASWLGVETIYNDRRDKPYEEKIEDYLLRHIRPLPRDIVILGNRLCTIAEEAKKAGLDRLGEESIKAVVNQAAREFGELQLTICSNQIAADLLYPGSAAYGSEDTKVYSPTIKDQLKVFLHDTVGRDRFDNQHLKCLALDADREFHSYTDLLSVLWQNGLLGYGNGTIDQGELTFYRLDDRAEELLLPRDRDFYVLHSCMIDATGVISVGPPVFPHLR